MKNVCRTPVLIAATVMLMASSGFALAEGNTGTAFIIWENESAEHKPLTPMAQLLQEVPEPNNYIVAHNCTVSPDQCAPGYSVGKVAAAQY